jgi:hypothetical protein
MADMKMGSGGEPFSSIKVNRPAISLACVVVLRMCCVLFLPDWLWIK